MWLQVLLEREKLTKKQIELAMMEISQIHNALAELEATKAQYDWVLRQKQLT